MTSRGALGSAVIAAGLLLSGLVEVAAQGLLPANAFADLAVRVRPGVVTVAAAVVDKSAGGVKRVDNEAEDDDSNMGDFSLGAPRPKKGQAPRRYSSVGSGFIIDPSGLVVTNNHVIEGGEEIYVILSDGTELKVDKVIGRDPKTDLTVLKITPKAGGAFTPVSFGDSQRLRVGDWVIAIGNPFGLKGSVTAGILSGKGRDISAGPYDEFLQTDAPINRGNSGGPLFNAAGEVIGINTAIFSPSGGSIGIGFAIPSNTAKRVIEQIKQYGETRWGFVGVRVQSLNEDIASSLGLSRPDGALVARVDKGGPADTAGLREGDVILNYNGTAVHTARDLPRLVARSLAGETVTVDIIRQHERQSLPVKVALLNEKTGGAAVAPRVAPPRRQRAAKR